MIATQERVRGDAGTPDTLIWHKSVDRSCDGECDFHAIACSPDEGISAPGPLREVPLDLDESEERWCPDCLAMPSD